MVFQALGIPRRYFLGNAQRKEKTHRFVAGPAPPKERPCSVAHWMQSRGVLFHVATGVPDK